MPKAFRHRLALAALPRSFAPLIRENTMIPTLRRPRSPRPATALALSAPLALALALSGQPAAAQSPYRLPVIPLEAGGHAIRAEMASSETQHTRGLMQRSSMPENHGMLFVFEAPARYCFWMKDTLIPLSIAFIDDEGRITDLADMRPRDEDNHHCPSRPVRMALEMNQGWFAARRIGPGQHVQGLPGVARADDGPAVTGERPAGAQASKPR